MIQNLTKNLNHYKIIVEKITSEDFSKKIPVLSDSSIGQHLRHVLEFYLCLFSGIEKETVCYDERKRDLLLEIDKDHALDTISSIIKKIELIKTDNAITLQVSMSEKSDDFIKVNSTIYRELVYGFDHSIHHQALIKIGMKELNHDAPDENFGIAPSTIKYKKECAQ
jgi:hypothetical protein